VLSYSALHATMKALQNIAAVGVITGRMANAADGLTFTFGADGQRRQALRPCMFGPIRNPNTTKDQENLLVALAN